MTAIPRHSSIPEDVLLGRSAFQDQVFAAVPKAVVCQTRDHICRSIQNSRKVFAYPQQEACGRFINDLIVTEERKLAHRVAAIAALGDTNRPFAN